MLFQCQTSPSLSSPSPSPSALRPYSLEGGGKGGGREVERENGCEPYAWQTREPLRCCLLGARARSRTGVAGLMHTYVRKHACSRVQHSHMITPPPLSAPLKLYPISFKSFLPPLPQLNSFSLLLLSLFLKLLSSLFFMRLHSFFPILSYPLSFSCTIYTYDF